MQELTYGEPIQITGWTYRQKQVVPFRAAPIPWLRSKVQRQGPRKGSRLKLSTKGEQSRHFGWTSAYVKPAGKYWKRIANKTVRRTPDLPNGNAYKKAWDWFEWC